MRYSIILCLVLLIGCQKHVERTYTLGVIGNLEGRNANTDGLRAVQMAVEDYQKDHPRSPGIRVLSMDDSWDPVKCRQAYQQLANQCDFIFLQTTSTAFLAVYPEILKTPHVLHMTVGPATTEISDKIDNVIRNNLDTALEQTSIADYLTEHEFAKILVARESERNGAYTESAFKHFRNRFKGEVDKVDFSADHFDLTPLMADFHANHYDMVYILTGGAPAEAAVIIQNIHRDKPEMPVMTSPWVRGRFFTEAVGKYADQVVIPEYTLMSPKNKRFTDFSAKFAKRFGSEPGYTAYYSNDLIVAFLEAFDRLEKTDAKLLIDEITRRQHEGVNGPFRFTTSGDVENTLHFYRIHGNGYDLIQ
jgi:ABC-type branched-subunit amino acid transport system substrate-binding protein